MKIHQSFPVAKNQKACYQTKILELEGGLKAQPGQFVMLWLPKAGEKPFSIMKDEPVSFLICSQGKVSRALTRLKKGEKAWLRGPFGKGFRLQGKKVLLVAGGYGVSPLYFLACRLDKKKTKITVIIGAKSKNKLALEEEFQKLGVKVILVTEDNSWGENGLVTQVQEKLVEKQKFDQVYACGPKAMLKKVVRICQKQKIPFQISLEQEIKCGLGICGHCAWGRYLICRDGPVFNFWPQEGG